MKRGENELVLTVGNMLENEMERTDSDAGVFGTVALLYGGNDMDFAILGFGNRGQMFADFIAEDKDTRLVAVCDVSAAARLAAKKKYKAENIYSDAESFFAAGKQADALFICTQDKEHRAHAVAAMKAGYDICLEKPVATTWRTVWKFIGYRRRRAER